MTSHPKTRPPGHIKGGASDEKAVCCDLLLAEISEHCLGWLKSIANFGGGYSGTTDTLYDGSKCAQMAREAINTIPEDARAFGVARPLVFEPHIGTPMPWGATGVFGDKYWAADSGKWESDPENSGPDPDDVARHQAHEDRRLLEALSVESRTLLGYFIANDAPSPH